MKQFLSAIARVFAVGVPAQTIEYDTKIDAPIYDQLKWEFQQRNPHFTLTKGM